MNEVRGLVTTDAGMQVLWHRKPFEHVVDYESWEDALLEDEDIAEHIRAGAVVPIWAHSDGVFECVVRWGENAALTEAEESHVVVRSEPYLLISETDVRVGGLEHVTGVAAEDEGFAVPLPPGRWDVITHVIDGAAHDEDIDFIVLIRPGGGGHHRTEVRPYDRPDQ